jgi:hypothetical protein
MSIMAITWLILSARNASPVADSSLSPEHAEKHLFIASFRRLLQNRRDQARRIAVPSAPTLQQATHANLAKTSPFPIDILTTLSGVA